MTTLAEQIAQLITSNEDLQAYFLAKRDEINAAVTAAVAAVPQSTKSFYVDQVNGDDAAVGAQDTPLKTIAAAAARTPSGGFCTVRLMSDYTFTSIENVMGIHLTVLPSGDERRNLNFQSIEQSGLRVMTGIRPMRSPSIGFFKINLNVTSTEADISSLAGLFSSGHSANDIAFTLALIQCDLDLPDAWNGALVSEFLLTSLQAYTVVGGKPGKWMTSVAAGSLTKDLPFIRTNLVSL